MIGRKYIRMDLNESKDSWIDISDAQKGETSKQKREKENTMDFQTDKVESLASFLH